MKTIIFILSLIVFSNPMFSQNNVLNIIVIGGHPDDADLLTGGTAIKFSQLGHKVLFVSVTNGDAGHFNTGGGALAKIRRNEAQEAGKRFGVSYHVMDNHDGELTADLNIRLDIIRLIREWNGVTHVVDVVQGGFLCNGQRYASLSPIARAITGARWSGPRFFGLKRSA